MNTRAWLDWARLYLHLFRLVVVSLCVCIAAYAWLAKVDWLLAASLCIGLGELLECTYYLTVLEWGRRSHRLSLPTRQH